MKIVLFGMFLLIFATVGFGQDESDDLKELSAVETFAIGPVGYAATVSRGETLARKLLAGEKAESRFQQILENGTPEARLYALWALRKIQGRASKKIFDAYRELSTEVGRMSGCEMFTEKFSEAVREIEKPFYLQIKAKDLWSMDLAQRKAMLTNEEERFLLMIFKKFKAADELEKIADVEFGRLFEKEAAGLLGN